MLQRGGCGKDFIILPEKVKLYSMFLLRGMESYLLKLSLEMRYASPSSDDGSHDLSNFPAEPSEMAEAFIREFKRSTRKDSAASIASGDSNKSINSSAPSVIPSQCTGMRTEASGLSQVLQEQRPSLLARLLMCCSGKPSSAWEEESSRKGGDIWTKHVTTTRPSGETATDTWFANERKASHERQEVEAVL